MIHDEYVIELYEENEKESEPDEKLRARFNRLESDGDTRLDKIKKKIKERKDKGLKVK